ncbi:hypothetical protein TRFO_36011 [Tritrichomonas foetus]|uniref:Uncharacterized protein n=1 Tax=Tritrichomonas foetus TaxID=1144522 RepID=A0A1J4JJM8_9EUKA|nr:hypothetical protein TRFO_36011 [Tritrichomonas foetus]|eukprot:OHS97723.1 hypothetical protein TRFO_36011 [Tritrichomonas foetus]
MKNGRNNEPPNLLLSSLVKYLNSKEDVSFKKIKNLILNSDQRQLLQSFQFLRFWINSNDISPFSPSNISLQQTGYAFYSLIISQIPPASLITDNSQFALGDDNIDLFLQDALEPLLYRIKILKELSVSYFTENVLFGIPLIVDQSVLNINMELKKSFLKFYQNSESHPEFQHALKKKFIELIVNRAPISNFQKLFFYRCSKSIFTTAIIELIKEMNFSRTAEESSLIYSFASLFLYIQMFIKDDCIDIQSLSDAIKSFWCYSPYMMLAIVNYIPRSSPLFYLLMPDGPIQSDELNAESYSSNNDNDYNNDNDNDNKDNDNDNKDNDNDNKDNDSSEDYNSSYRVNFQIIQKAYPIVNLVENKKKEILEITTKMPKILYNYFLPSSQPDDYLKEKSKNLIDFIVRLHLTNSSNYMQMKYLFDYLREKEIRPIAITMMSSNLINSMILTMNRASSTSLLHTGPFDFKIIRFKSTTFAFLAPTHGQAMMASFFSNHNKKKIKDKSQQVTGFFFSVLSNPENNFLAKDMIADKFIPYCLAIISNDYSNEANELFISRLVFTTTLLTTNIKITKDVVDFFHKKTSIDLPTVIEFIDYLNNIRPIKCYNELQTIHKLRNELIKSLPFTISSKSPLIFNGIKNDFNLSVFNHTSQGQIQLITSINSQNSNKITFNWSNLTARIFLRFEWETIFINKKYDEFIDFLCDLKTSEKETKFLTNLKIALPTLMVALKRLCLMYSKLPYNQTSNLSSTSSYTSSSYIPGKPSEDDIQKYSHRLAKIYYRLSSYYDDNILPNRFFLEIVVNNYKAFCESPYFINMKNYIIEILMTNIEYRSLFGKLEFSMQNILIILLKLQKNKCDSPSIIFRNYTSKIHSINDLIIILLLLKFKKEDLMNELIKPLTSSFYLTSDRESEQHIIAYLTSKMPYEIAYSLFLKLIEISLSTLMISTVRFFLSSVHIDVFCDICSNCEKIIGKDENKITLYLKAVIPNFPRLIGNENVTKNFLCGLISSIPLGESIQKQEEILDMILVVYTYLDTQGQDSTLRKDIIESANKNKAAVSLKFRNILAQNLPQSEK